MESKVAQACAEAAVTRCTPTADRARSSKTHGSSLGASLEFASRLPNAYCGASCIILNIEGDWQGVIIADGYSAHDNLGNNICRTSCLIYIRRPFSEIVESVSKDKLESMPNVVSLEALRRIEEIFHIDNTFNDVDATTRKVACIEILKPKIDAFFLWCIQKQDEAIPSMALRKALSYAINQWPKLENVLTDGRLHLENNRAERAIRPLRLAGATGFSQALPVAPRLSQGSIRS